MVRNNAISGCCSNRVLISSMTLPAGSNSVQPHRPEPGEDFLDFLARRRLRLLELIIHSKPLPFEAAQLMERQHVHAVDVAQARGEVRDLPDLLQVIRPAGYDYEANPGGPF